MPLIYQPLRSSWPYNPESPVFPPNVQQKSWMIPFKAANLYAPVVNFFLAAQQKVETLRITWYSRVCCLISTMQRQA